VIALAYVLAAVGWFGFALRGVNWKAAKREPVPSTVAVVVVIACGAAVWPVMILAWPWLRRRKVLA